MRTILLSHCATAVLAADAAGSTPALFADRLHQTMRVGDHRPVADAMNHDGTPRRGADGKPITEEVSTAELFGQLMLTADAVLKSGTADAHSMALANAVQVIGTRINEIAGKASSDAVDLMRLELDEIRKGVEAVAGEVGKLKARA